MYAYVRNNPTTLNDPSGLDPPVQAGVGDPNAVAWTEWGDEPESSTGAIENWTGEDPQTVQVQAQQAQQKTDTVTFTEYKGEDWFNPAGHIGVSVDGSPGVGYTDKNSSDDIKAFLGEKVPGDVRPIKQGREIQKDDEGKDMTVTMHVTHDEADHMRQFIAKTKASPRSYQRGHNNCSEWAADVAHAGGIKVPRDMYPSDLIRDLRKAAGSPP